MNIAIVVRRFEKTGGVERAAVELALGLRNAGQTVAVYSTIRDNRFTDGLQIHHVPSVSACGSAAIASFHLSSRSYVRRTSHDIVHAHGLEPSQYNIMTFQSCHKAGIAARHALLYRDIRSRNLHVADQLRCGLEKRVFRNRRYKHLIAVSEGVKRELCELYDTNPDDITVIPNGVNHEEFRPTSSEQKHTLRHQFGLHHERTVLLFVGNEFERKGLQVLIDALQLLSDEPVTLLVVGKDDPSDYIAYIRSHKISADIRFLGLVDQLNQIYSLSDVFVLPTYYEAFSLATVEAAASALPLLVTKVNGTEDLVRDGVNGLFIERDPHDIASKIRIMLSTERRTAMARAACESSLLYSWSSIAHKTLEVYSSVIGSGGHTRREEKSVSPGTE